MCSTDVKAGTVQAREHLKRKGHPKSDRLLGSGANQARRALREHVCELSRFESNVRDPTFSFVPGYLSSRRIRPTAHLSMQTKTIPTSRPEMYKAQRPWKNISLAISTTIAPFLLAACNLGAAGVTPTVVADTMTPTYDSVSMLTGIAPSPSPLVIPSSAAQSTLGPLLFMGSVTPIVTETPAPIIYPTSAPNLCDVAGFVEDVTIPDGTDIVAGTSFKKTWRLSNAGTCTWTSDYDVVYSSGDQMGGDSSVSIGTDSVAPGDTVDVSVKLVAPSDPGEYIGYWLLRNASGDIFGIGAGNYTFYVDINVTAATVTSTPTVTSTARTSTPTPQPSLAATSTPLLATSTPTATQVVPTATSTNLPTATASDTPVPATSTPSSTASSAP